MARILALDEVPVALRNHLVRALRSFDEAVLLAVCVAPIASLLRQFGLGGARTLFIDGADKMEKKRM